MAAARAIHPDAILRVVSGFLSMEQMSSNIAKSGCLVQLAMHVVACNGNHDQHKQLAIMIWYL